MKRLFQRPSSSSALSRSSGKDSSPSSPDSAGDGSPGRRARAKERRSYSPEKLAAVFRKSSPEKRAVQAAAAQPDDAHAHPDETRRILKRAASASISDDELHGKVVEYMTATSEAAQDAALRDIHAAILEDVAASGVRIRVSQKDTDKLISVCSQRLRLAFQRRLDAFNAALLRAPAQAPPSFLGESDDNGLDRFEVALGVLKDLLSEDQAKAAGHMILVVSERLPSTLVKVLKACTQSDEQASSDARIADLVLAVLSRLVRFQETVHELSEASTLHRLFLLTFDATERQYATLQLIEVMVEATQGSLWGAILSHLHEHRCLLELFRFASDTKCLVKAVAICARVLRVAYERSYLALHKQLRLEQFYSLAFSTFESTFDVDGDEAYRLQQDLRLAIGELCLSGSESALVMADVTNDQCFALCKEKAPAKVSFFNIEAFWIVCQILDFLHLRCADKDAQDLAAEKVKQVACCQNLECQYLQKIGRLIAENRFDYVLIRRSGIMEQLLRRLNKLSDLSKHAVGSVLAATAIEANVIPYSELTTIGVYIGHATQTVTTHNRDTDLLVLLSFVTNLLRFHEAYRSILRKTGVIEAIISLFQAQTVLFSSDEVAVTKINVAYPTSQLKIGHSSWHRRHSPGGTGSDWVLPVTEKNLVMFLTSHCRQNSTGRKIETRHAVDRRVFALVLEVLTAFTEQATNSSEDANADAEDEDAVHVGLCDPPVLECICVLLASHQYQDSALLLWRAVIQIALRIKKQNTSTYNAVNCFLQSLRYVGLSLYYKNEPGIKFAFQASVDVLRNGLSFLEDAFRPDLPIGSYGMNECERDSTGMRFASKVHRDRLLVALVDSGGLYTFLALCCALTRALSEFEEHSEKSEMTYCCSDSAFVLSTQLVHILVTSNGSVAELFDCAVSYGFYGNLFHRYLSRRIECSGHTENIESSSALCRSLLQGLLGFAASDYGIARGDVECDPLVNKMVQKIVQPGALIVFVQLIRLWSSSLESVQVEQFLDYVGGLLETPENARICSSTSLCNVLLESFATIGDPSTVIGHDVASDAEFLHMSLLCPSSRYHATTIRILKRAVAGGISHNLACRWIKLLVDASGSPRSTDSKTESSPTIVVTPLLNVFAELATGESTTLIGNTPAISFDSSSEGFAQMQIPEVLVRSQGNFAFHSPAQSATPASTSASSFAALTAKAWPPPDGYTVMVWFRIDANETKDAREKHYWDMLMKNLCVLCHSSMKDEASLKCSHRACRPCQEALTSCGGECVVCNPPMFYLFRFRSGDTKSVTEMFLRGSKLCMRTSAATKTGVHQFSHAPLQVGRWYHAAVVHSRQRFQSSQVSLYLNGLLQETVKISYPSGISSGQPLSGLIGIPSQARRLSTSKWAVGSFYLLDEALSAHLVNAAFAVGPSYGGLYIGPSGSNELLVSVDHLSVESLLLLDEYTRDPIRSIIESVEAAERSGKNSILRSSLSIASAASSAAAAIVQDIKARGTSSGIFGRIPSAVPVVSMPLSQDRITLVYSSSTAVGVDFSIIPSSKLDGRPIAQLLGGAAISTPFNLADTLHDVCGSGPRFAYILLEQATGVVELELTLEFLWQMMRNHPKNLMAMEDEHGYGIVNYLLHQKVGAMLTAKTLALLFRIVGIDIDDDTTPSNLQPRRESAIRNLLALQHFILDYSLWQNAPAPTQKMLFSSLYASMMAGGDEEEALARERNRAQLQSLSLVRQLLYVFLDPDVDGDLLRVIADLILVCLTGSNRNESATVEANFAEIASFLASSLSPRFARNRDIFEDESSARTPHSAFPPQNGSQIMSPNRRRFDLLIELSSETQSPVHRLCLSPRGKSGRLDGSMDEYVEGMNERNTLPPSSNPASPKSPSSSSLPVAPSIIRVRQTQAQDMLLDILVKAVQKHDLKENRERDEVEGMYVESSNSTALPTPGGASAISAPSATGQRLQISTSISKLAGFRKVLSPRWIGYFLFPANSSCSVTIAPSTVIAALKLLAALLNRPRYESVFRKDGYYRLLSQGLPCDHRAFLAVGSSFPFDQMWYSLFCMLLGPPVDGVPHEIKFDMYFLTKDFALNVHRDRLVNPNMLWVMLALMRRHYNDPVAFATLQMLRISPEKSIMAQVAHVLYAKSPEDSLCHSQVLDFFHHVYTSMPALRRLLVLSQGASSSSHSSNTTSGSESKLRGEIMEELSLLACSVARAELFVKYAPSEKRVHQTLLNQKRDLNASQFASCTVEIAEQSASEDSNGEDPFQHPVAVRAMKVLVAILCDFLVLHPKGVDHVEAFFDSDAGSALAPTLHSGLQLRFQTLVMMNLLEQVRIRFTDESVLSEHKGFASNIKEFMSLAIQKMHMWQRAQHGDACPTAFECCGDKFHFTGGPFVLLDLALYFLGDTTAGVTASASSASTSSTLGQMIQDKLNSGSKGGKKRRHTLKSMILGKVQFGSSKSAELEGLASSMYSAVNAVILHVLQGHGSEVSDDECETLLQLVHVHREVVLNTRNTQDREFLICLCRFLLQLLAAGGGEGRPSVGEYDRALQEIAAQIWIDLMQLQRPLMVELLTVELRRAGGAPYVVNLMKNGFDVLLDCHRTDADTSSQIIDSAPFKKFKGWLDIVGPPLKELETNLDRVFVKRMVEAKEVVRDAWAASHKRQASRHAKETKRFASRFEWFANMERTCFEALIDAQQSEFRRQLKWRQDRIDRQKFHARQWQKLRHDLMEQALRRCDDDEASTGYPNLLGSEIARQVGQRTALWKSQCTSWLLDATEGPSRMRKRLIAKVQSDDSIEMTGELSSPSSARTGNVSQWQAHLRSRDQSNLRRRRYSESDVETLRALIREDPRLLGAIKPDRIQLRRPERGNQTVGEKKRGEKPRPVSRRLSFEDVLRGTQHGEAAGERSGVQGHEPPRKDSSLSATNDLGSGDEDDQDQEASFAGGSPTLGEDEDTDAIDEKLRPLLVLGDEIMDIYDCLRVDGMDACPGVFILCSDHLYIVDNYQLVLQYGPALPGTARRRGPGNGSDTVTNAKVMEVSADAPTRLERRLSLRFQLPSPAVERPQTPSGTLTMQRSTFTHQCRFWAYEDVVELHKRRHQLRHVALELFAHDGRNYLITFESPEQRENVFHSLLAKCPNVRGAANGMDRTTTSGDLYSQLKKLLRQNMTERWISREISNFEYLMHLNTLAGRSYNDLTQYPVFPWVLSDYTSSTLDLTDSAVYRDLTKPMGALFREEEFRTRYESLLEGGSDEMDDPMIVKPFHYGTHYSSAGIVLHYLMRMEPFTTHFRRLQGGKFDHADRLFSSVASAWKSAAGTDNAHNGTQDVKELTPEFFYLPSFLRNLNHHEFGTDQNGLSVDDVELPPWANGSAREFVRINREALESPFVSANLHHWIDLIFGWKQQGPAAIEACNVFYHLTYEGAVDLDSITDLAMRRAMVDQISEFGQTPSQLFKTPHPPRLRLSSPPAPSGVSGGLQSSLSSGSSGGEGGTSYAGLTVGSPLPGSAGGFSLASSSGTRTALTSSFIEGSDIVSRMHSILTNNSSLGSATSSLLDDSTAILDHAAMLQQEPRRDVGVNPVVAAYRGHHQQSVYTSGTPAMVTMRTRQLSSGVPAAPIHQIAIASASVTRDERVAAVGDRCLLIPPRHHEFFAWGFQDRSLKILSTGSSEVAHGGDSKVLASFEIDFPISVACMTSDGRTLIAGGAIAPVVRLWQFSASKKAAASTASSGGVGRKRAYSVGLPGSMQSARSLVPLATLCSPSHRAPLTAVRVCRAYSVVVSGCGSGVAVLWDLNRLRYSRTLRSLQPDESVREPISAIAINEVTGDIAVACGAIFGVFDVNGELLARVQSETLRHDSQYPRAAIASLAVNRSEASAWCREKAVVTGHADGVLCIWAYAHAGYGDGEVSIELKGRHMVSKALAGGSAASTGANGMAATTTTSRSAITAVLLSSDERKLFTGNADGLLSLWTPMAPSGGAPTTPTKSLAASASPLPAHPTSLV